MINCISFFWGSDPYSPEYVNKLFNSIDRHLSIEHRNICFTNQPEGIREGIEIRPLHNEWMKGNLKKAIQFDLKNNWDGRVLSFDLDNVILNSLDVFSEYTSPFVICAAITKARKGKCGGNFMVFDSDFGHDLWYELNMNYKKYENETGGSERFLYDRLISYPEFFEPGLILSYKAQYNIKNRPNIDNVRMLWMHGKPKPHEIEDPLVIDNWK